MGLEDGGRTGLIREEMGHSKGAIDMIIMGTLTEGIRWVWGGI